MVWPPSRYTVCPVMKSEAGEARYTASAAASSGSPRRRAGTLDRKRSRVFGSAIAARDIGVHVPGREAIDLYAMPGPLRGKAPCEPIDGRLAGAVRGVVGHAQTAVHGSDVDNLAPPARDHSRAHCAAAAKHRREIRRQHPLPLVVADLEC